jgi:hypothetical protein
LCSKNSNTPAKSHADWSERTDKNVKSFALLQNHGSGSSQVSSVSLVVAVTCKVRTEVSLYHSDVAEDSGLLAYDAASLGEFLWDLFALKDYETTFFRNAGNNSPNDTALCYRRC